MFPPLKVIFVHNCVVNDVHVRFTAICPDTVNYLYFQVCMCIQDGCYIVLNDHMFIQTVNMYTVNCISYMILRECPDT